MQRSSIQRLFGRRFFSSLSPQLNASFKYVTPGLNRSVHAVPSVPDLSESSVLNLESHKISRFQQQQAAALEPELERKRVVPALNTFYAANPIHQQNVIELQKLLAKYTNLPLKANAASKDASSADGAEEILAQRESNTRWVNMNEYRLIGGGTRLKPTQYYKLVEILDRLEAIDKQLVNQEVADALDKYRKPLNKTSQLDNVKSLDQFGRAKAVGRRKTSSAKVYLARGEGNIIINGEPLNVVFPRLTDRKKIMYPLQVVDSEGSYNIFAKSSGGGVSGQVGAIALGITKALIIFNPLLKPRLRKAGCVTRDSRVVERKKPGKVKSRKSPTWVKR